MSVIAKKIAHAAEQPLDRSDASAMARHIEPVLVEMLSDWLGVDELDDVASMGHWIALADLEIPDVVISRQGLGKSRRATMAISEPLALSAVGHLLRIPVVSDPSVISALKPFLSETVLSLETTINGFSFMEGLSDGREGWSMLDRDELIPLLGEEDVIQLTMKFRAPDGSPARVDLVLTSDLLDCDSTLKASESPDLAATPKQAPRLGPCHVDVKAIADRLRMSVADCSRLEIGQVVALPGLRFDYLELTVEMGEGPVPLVDASLGADKGIKAVRLNRGLDPAFKAPPAQETTGAAPSGFDTVHA